MPVFCRAIGADGLVLQKEALSIASNNRFTGRVVLTYF